MECNWYEFIFFNDEFDEYYGVGVVVSGIFIIYIMDFSDFEKFKYIGYFENIDYVVIDYNLYVEKGIMFQFNYGVGVWVIDVKFIKCYFDGSCVCKLVFFDMYLEDDVVGGLFEFVGFWGNFQFLLGFIVVNIFECGVYVF